MFFPFSGPDLPSWIPGMCRHRHHLHRPHAPSRVLPRVLSLLRQLRWEDVPEADIVHPLSQENALLEFIPHHNRHPVSVSNTHTHTTACIYGGLTTLPLCSIGNICMFQSNNALNENIDQAPLNLNRTINNIRTFLSAVPQVRERMSGVRPSVLVSCGLFFKW